MMYLAMTLIIVGFILTNRGLTVRDPSDKDYLLHKNTLNTAFMGAMLTSLGMFLALISAIQHLFFK